VSAGSIVPRMTAVARIVYDAGGMLLYVGYMPDMEKMVMLAWRCYSS